MHALGHAWTGHLFWVLVAGLILALVALLGLALMRRGAARARRLRRERATLLAENERLSDPSQSPFFAGDGAANEAPAQASAPAAHPTERRRFLRRTHRK